MKKVLTLFIIAVLLVFGCTTALAAEETAGLYSYYADNMLFRQNDEAIFAGKAAPGTPVRCELYNSQNQLLKFSESTASADGTFSLSFTAPSGGFEEYTVKLLANGEVFRELKGVVFGELWLAGGQSNMQLELRYSLTGSQMVAEGKTGI